MCTARSYSLLTLALIIGAAASHPNVATAASDQDRAGARSVATQAFEAFKNGEYEVAIDLLKRAESLVHAPAHWLYIARSYEKLGRLVLAQEAYLKAAREPIDENSSDGFREAVSTATTELEALQPRIARLTVQVVGATSEQAEVRIDGLQVPQALVGVPMPADPGAREVTASAPGMLTASLQVNLTEGAREVVELRLLPDQSLAPQQAPAAPEVGLQVKSTEVDARVEQDRTLLYIGAGAAVVGGVALGLGMNAWSNADEPQERADALYEECNNDLTGCSRAERNRIHEWDEEAKTLRTPAWVWLGVGAAGIASGATLLVLHFVQSDNASDKAEASVAPWVGVNGFGLVGKF